MTTPSEIHDKIANIPNMKLDEGIIFTDHIIKYNIKSALELGFYQGVSTCYIANALSQTGGTLTTIDKNRALLYDPNINDLLKRCELNNVKIYTEPESFTWRLMHMIKNKNNHRFELAFIDGGHTWDCTGFSFFLVDQLLDPGGWIVFDDYRWKISTSSRTSWQTNKRSSRFPKEYNDEFDSTEQIKNVVDLLVRPHPEYTITNIVNDKYVFAQKRHTLLDRPWE